MIERKVRVEFTGLVSMTVFSVTLSANGLNWS